MHAKKWLFILINLLGGPAVLGSYVYGLRTQSDVAEILWGGVPGSLRPYYSVNMILAAAGYFAFTYFILFRLNPSERRIFGRYGFGVFNMLYATILFLSALWLPVTFLAVEQSSLGLVWAVRLLLALVGLASLVLLLALLNVNQRQPLWSYRAALVGCAFFCIQTAILDAVIWGSLFEL